MLRDDHEQTFLTAPYPRPLLIQKVQLNQCDQIAAGLLHKIPTRNPTRRGEIGRAFWLPIGAAFVHQSALLIPNDDGQCKIVLRPPKEACRVILKPSPEGDDRQGGAKVADLKSGSRRR
jgi:hypothetical protein